MADEMDALIDKTIGSDFKKAKFVASQRQPEEHAQVLNTARKLQIAPSVVEGAKEEAFKQASVIQEEDEYDKILNKYKRTAKYLSNPDNASVSKDDLGSLKKLEDDADEHSFAGELLSSIGSVAARSAQGLAQAPGIIGPMATRLMGVDNPAEREQIEFFINSPLARSLGAKAQSLQPKDMSADILQEAKEGNYKKASRAAAFQIVGNMSQLALLVANPAAGLLTLGTSSAGSKFSQNIEQGVEPGKAATNALATAGAETAIEMTGGIGANAFKQTIKNTIAALGEQGAKEVFKNGFKHIIKTSGEEGAEEFFTSISQDLIDYAQDVNPKALDGIIQRALNAGIVGAGAGGMTTVATQSIETGSYKIANAMDSVPDDIKKMWAENQKAEAVKQYVNGYVANRKESKTYKRIPEKFAEAHASHVQGTPLEELAVPVEAFNEVVFNQDKTKSPAEVAASLGILEKWERAQQSGSDITLTPMDMAKLDDKVISALSGDFKAKGQELSANEIKERREQEQAEQDINNDLQQAAREEQVSREKVRTRITQDITKQLIDTELYNPQDARINAQAVSSFFNAMADREGKNLEDLYAKYAPKIVKQMSGPKEKSFISKVMGAIGGSYTPEGRVIQLTQARDFASFVHESGHFFLDVMSQVQADKQASEGLKSDFSYILKYVGSKDGKLTEAQHEKFTEAFINYLQEGKAPSAALKRVFTRVRQWLLDVFKGMRNSPELNPAIKGVFDRMLATQDELKELKEDYDSGPFSSGEALQMEGEELKKYNDALEDARYSVQQDLKTKAIEKVNKGLSSEFKEQRALIEEDVRKEADQQMVFKVIEDIKNNDIIGRMSREFIEETGIENFPEKYMKKGGANPADWYSFYGYNSPYEMLKDIADNPDKGAWIFDETQNRMSRQHPDLYPVFDLSDDAVKAVHGEKREKVLRMQMDWLMKKASGTVKGIAKDLIRRTPSKKVVQQQAEKIIAGTQLSEIKPYLFRRAEVKFSKIAGQKFAKGDFVGAFEAKRMEYLNFELYNQAQAALADRASDDNFRKFFKKDEDIAKTRDLNYVNAARAVLSLYGFGGDKKTLDEILKPIESYDPGVYAALSEMISDAALNSKPIDDAKFAEYQAMKDLVDALWALAKSNKEITVQGRQITQQEAIDGVRGEFGRATKESPESENLTKTEQEENKNVLLSAIASFRRVEHWANGIGENTLKTFFKPVSDAAIFYRGEHKRVLKKFRDVLDSNKEYFKDSGKKVEAKNLRDDGKPVYFSKTELMMAILHSGNVSNKTKLLVGRGWGKLNEDGSLDSQKWDSFLQEKMADGTISKKDMDMAQKIWDLLESLKPEAQKAHKKLYGYYFKEVTADAFETPFGKYRGGYIPARLDVDALENVKDRKEARMMEEKNHSFQFPTAGKGFTISRNKSNGPLSLDMNLLGTHVGQVLRFSHMEPTIREVYRLTENPEMKAILRAHDKTNKEMLTRWLDRSVMQKVVIPSDGGENVFMDKAASFLRQTAAVQAMFMNVVNAAQQPVGLVVAMTKVPPKKIMASFKDYFFRGGGLTEWKKSTYNKANGQANQIAEMSPFMKSLYEDGSFEVQQELEKILSDSGAFKNIADFTQKHTYFLQTMMQNMVNTITWKAAFNDYMEQHPGASQEQAVDHADGVVRTTQGTQNAEDVSAFETGTPTQRLFKQFIGYFNMLYNLNRSEFERIQNDTMDSKKSRIFMAYMFGFALPAFLSAQIVKALGPDDDKEEDSLPTELLMSFFGSQFQQLLAVTPIPFANQVAQAWYGRFNDKIYDDRLNLSPGLTMIDKLGDMGEHVGEYVFEDKDVGGKLTMDVLNNIALFAKLPVTPVLKRAEYLNKSDDPTVRGIITGR